MIVCASFEGVGTTRIPVCPGKSQQKAFKRQFVMLLLKGGGVLLFLLLCLIRNADAAENLSVGRECVEGGVEDRGQVKLKHGAQEKQRPPTFLTSLYIAVVNASGQGSPRKCKASPKSLFWQEIWLAMLTVGWLRSQL